MAIPESTLVNWSHLGSVQQSAATYQAIKGVIEDCDSPYNNRSFSTFLQGSYGNDTNIRSDSDVDIVVCTSSLFYYDLSNLDTVGKNRFEDSHPGSANYSYAEFKNEVTGWLIRKYGAAVKPGSKAIYIRGNGSRRDGDVLPAAEFRHYWSFQSASDDRHAKGIVFWNSNGTRIVNFPKQHSDNCTAKHQSTGSWFKPTVRIFKNMRNKMIQDRILSDGVAPSYYIEGLLSNAADSCFGHSFERTVLQCIHYLSHADRNKMMCANGIHWLVRDGQEVCWPTANFNTFMAALPLYWNNFPGGR